MTDRNPVELTLENDSIYPPTVFVRALQAAWIAWRMHELQDDEVASEMSTLCEWLNLVSKNKPKTAFWKKVF